MRSHSFGIAGHVNAAAEDCRRGGKVIESANHLGTAIHLWALTGQQRFEDRIVGNIEEDAFLLRERHMVFDTMAQETQDHLAYYSALPGAHAAIATNIVAEYRYALTNPYVPFAPLTRYREVSDPYRAYLDYYSWSSGRGKAQAGIIFTNLIDYGLESGSTQEYCDAAAGYLHYLYGTNSLGIVYLSNMGEHGAENSVPELYHLWFKDGSPCWDNVNDSLYGPAPGYPVGGPNQNYDKSGVYIDGIRDTDHPRILSWTGCGVRHIFRLARRNDA